MIWYLGKTKPRQEVIAMINLERQGFSTYLPMIYRDVNNNNGKEVEVMFGGYIFLSGDQVDFQKVRSTRGMQKLVKFGEIPATLPDALICALRSKEDEEGYHGAKRIIRPGERARAILGPFDSYEGIVEASRSGRVTILLDTMKRLQVNENQVQLA